MKYIKLFENYRSYFEISSREYDDIFGDLSNDIKLYSFNRKDIEILSKFLNDCSINYEFIKVVITSCCNSFLLSDKYDVLMGTNGLSSQHRDNQSLTIFNSDDVPSTFKSNKGDDPVRICETDNYSLVLKSNKGKKIFINKLVDEWFVTDNRPKAVYKCDQISGLIDFFTEILPLL